MAIDDPYASRKGQSWSASSPALSSTPFDSNQIVYSVSTFIEQCNYLLEADFDSVIIEGEVASFKINQGKWVFFDLKEGDASAGCFMPLARLGIALTDGMKVRVRATPKLTRWGKFSLTVQQILPVGEGSIKKSFELLKQKLTAEGLFNPERKRPLPDHITRIGVISSTNAAGYRDFLKILDNRWGGLSLFVVNTQVQGLVAASQVARAIEYFNQRADVDVIAILRGGGSADDLSAFNDEALARAIVASRLPVITGIGHEVDESLADLAADVRASTPSNAAERLTPDRQVAREQVARQVSLLRRQFLEQISQLSSDNRQKIEQIKSEFLKRLEFVTRHLQETQKVLDSLNPEAILRRGYAIIAAENSPNTKNSDFIGKNHSKSSKNREIFASKTDFSPGNVVKITTFSQILTAEVKNVHKR